MSYGVINGLTGSYKITPARTKLPISSILPASDLVAGATPDTFVVQLTGLYQVDLSINLSSPGNNVLFTLELFNVTTGTMVQQRTGTVPGQAYPEVMYFGFNWDNLSATDEYAFYITPDLGAFYKDYALLVSDLNFRAVVQMFGGSGVLGTGTAGAIPVWTAHDTIGDSIMTQAGATITVAGAVSLAGANNATFMEFTDGQNVAVSAANQGRIRYNVNTQTFEFSENAGAWADLSGVGPGTTNKIAKFTSANTVGDSSLTDLGTGITQTQTIATSGSPTAWLLTAAAHTTLTASAEASDVNLNLARTVQFAAGPIVTQRAVRVQAPTYAFTAGPNAISSAATVSISGPPVAGANAVFLSTYALWIESGNIALSAGGALLWQSDVQLTKKDVNVIGVGNLSGSDAIRIGASGRIYGNAVTTTVDADVTHHTVDGAGEVTIACTATGDNVVVGQTIVVSGWTWAAGGGNVNGVWLVTAVYTGGGIAFNATSPPTFGSNPTVVGTLTVVPQIILGNAPVTGSSTGTVLIPGTGTQSTCVGPGIGSGNYSVSLGGANVTGINSTGLGYATSVTANYAVGLGCNSVTRIEKTCNISGLDCVRLDDGQTDYWLYYGSRTNIVYGPEVDFLGAPVGVSVTIPANASAWIEEVGWIVVGFNVDGGALTVQPTVEFGITGTLDKYLAPVLTTLLTGLGKRARYSTLLADDGETTALTANMTVAGTIAGGGAGVKYKARPYWVIRVAENSSSPT
jgi:hypothetical protein